MLAPPRIYVKNMMFEVSDQLDATCLWTSGSQIGSVEACFGLSKKELFSKALPLHAKRKSSSKHPSTTSDQITVRRVRTSDAYELVYPRSVAARKDDMEEVRQMLAAEEIDVAEDELRWLVGGCPQLLEGHKLLGDIAAGDENWQLARVHYGYAYQLGLDAAKRIKPPATLPHARPNNRTLHEAGRGLAESLSKLGETDTAKTIVRRLLAWDPSDPLGVKAFAFE